MYIRSKIVMLASMVLALVLVAQDKPKPVPPEQPQTATTPAVAIKFALSDLENSRLETLRAEKKIVDLETRAHRERIQAYVLETLRAHGTPDNVVFNVDQMTWMIVPVKTEEEQKQSPGAEARPNAKAAKAAKEKSKAKQ